MEDDLRGKSPKDYGEGYEFHLLDQYKLYVEMADRISQRRLSANSFFISVNVALISLLTLFSSNVYGLIIFSISGILFSIMWYVSIKSYRQMSSGKFKVIHQLEKELPARLFDYEWNVLDHGKNKKKYIPISKIESIISLLFSCIYVFICLYILFFHTF